jgi:hypothetical protein
MNVPAALRTHRVGHSSDALAAGAEQRVARLCDAVEERVSLKGRPDPAESDDVRSPLWAVAIGTGCLLAAMAAVIALG